ncbi:MAG: Lrp/AsnC family transcriptional regulator [Candidatus Asgardarchaeia archaeon]
MSKNVTAYVLISVKTGYEYEVLDKIDDIKEVKEASITFGEWDIIVKIEVENLGKLDSIVIKIRKIKGVERTSTLIAA